MKKIRFVIMFAFALGLLMNMGGFTVQAQTTENNPAVCADSTDNDGDSKVDCADSDCAAFPPCNSGSGAPPAPPAPPAGGGSGDSVDKDGDGHFADASVPAQVDCDDADQVVYPGADEACDGKDTDCDGKMDDHERKDAAGTPECPSYATAFESMKKRGVCTDFANKKALGELQTVAKNVEMCLAEQTVTAGGTPEVIGVWTPGKGCALDDAHKGIGWSFEYGRGWLNASETAIRRAQAAMQSRIVKNEKRTEAIESAVSGHYVPVLDDAGKQVLDDKGQPKMKFVDGLAQRTEVLEGEMESVHGEIHGYHVPVLDDAGNPVLDDKGQPQMRFVQGLGQRVHELEVIDEYLDDKIDGLAVDVRGGFVPRIAADGSQAKDAKGNLVYDRVEGLKVQADRTENRSLDNKERIETLEATKPSQGIRVGTQILATNDHVDADGNLVADGTMASLTMGYVHKTYFAEGMDVFSSASAFTLGSMTVSSGELLGLGYSHNLMVGRRFGKLTVGGNVTGGAYMYSDNLLSPSVYGFFGGAGGVVEYNMGPVDLWVNADVAVNVMSSAATTAFTSTAAFEGGAGLTYNFR